RRHGDQPAEQRAVADQPERRGVRQHLQGPDPQRHHRQQGPRNGRQRRRLCAHHQRKGGHPVRRRRVYGQGAVWQI
ncbi:hypothetical protein H4R21_002736, partial [Coemansia helicoidea]